MKITHSFFITVLCLSTLVCGVAWGQSDRSVAPEVGIRFQPPGIVALTNAEVITAGGKLSGAVLLIEDGRILEVGTSVQIPAHAEVIDLHGDYLYPAFVDAFVEFDADELTSNGAHWNASVTPQKKMSESLKLEDATLKSLRAAGFAAALAAPNRGIFKGESCVILAAGSDLSSCLLRAEAFQHVRLYPSRGVSGYPNSPMGAVALVRQTLADADWYRTASQAAKAQRHLAGPEFNVALQELQPVIAGDQALIIDGPNELYELRADRMAREFALPLIIRGSGREYRRLDAIAALGRQIIVPIDFPDAPELETEQQLADATLQDLMHWELAPSNLARMHQAGIEFVITSDGLDDRKTFLTQLRKAVQAGLDKDIALRSVTSAPAELLGIDDVAGSIARGKLANLIRVDGDLFDPKTKILETWVQGEKFEIAGEESNRLAGVWRLEWQADDVPALDLRLAGTATKPTASMGGLGAFDLPPAAEKPKQPTEAASDEASKPQDGDARESQEPAQDEASDDDESTGNDEPLGDDATSEEEAAVPSIKLKKLKLEASGIAGSFSADKLWAAQPGIAFLTATELPRGETASLVGTVTWADGRRTAFTAVRVPEAEAKAADSETNDKPKKTKDPSDADAEELLAEVNYPLGAYGLTSQPEQPKWILFQNATIWTCGDAGILQEADLLVRKGKIEAVGRDLEVPPGAQIVDATGMHISPGIIDCHSHMATDGGVNESGQAITAEVRIADFIDPNDITIYRQLAGGVTASNILHGSANPIGGQNQVIKLRWGGLDEEMKMSEAPAGIKFALGENVKQSRYRESTRYPRSRMGVEQILRDRFEAAKAYRQNWSAWTTNAQGLPPRKDYELEAIAEILEGKRWVHCHSYRQDEILATLRVLEDYGVTIGSLQHILEGYKVAEAMAKHGATGSSFSDWWAYKFEVYDAIPYNGALMHRAGVVVSFNSDDRELARHLNHEAAKAVKYGGVSEEEALKFVTLNPAKQLRIDAWVGSLEAGKHADFVVWNRSPLSTMSACMQTWIDGRKYFDREQDLERRKADEALRLRLVQKVVDSGAKSGERSDDDPSYWWARHDEFCHHFDESHDDHEH
ncbi:MAG: amidohydrolase family protein [bacterium]|nr:amidohydrolase family protein [bacterium]